MSQELVYTSAPKGLKAGAHGFCMVLCSEGMPAPMATALEGLSAYKPVYAVGDPAEDRNPVTAMHVIIPAVGRKQHVLSRVASYGLDYSGRPNKLAHHVVLESADMAAGGPAWMLQQPLVMKSAWGGEPKVVAANRRLPAGDVQGGICRAWETATGDAGWAGVLAESLLKDPTRLAYLIIPPDLDPLPLFAEAIALLPPNRRWQATFSTYFTTLPANATCNWRCLLADSPLVHQSKRHVQALRLDLTGEMGKAAGGELVEAARTGVRAKVAASQPTTTAFQSAVSLDALDYRGAYDLSDLATLRNTGRLRRPPQLRRETAKSKRMLLVAVGAIVATAMIAVAIHLISRGSDENKTDQFTRHDGHEVPDSATNAAVVDAKPVPVVPPRPGESEPDFRQAATAIGPTPAENAASPAATQASFEQKPLAFQFPLPYGTGIITDDSYQQFRLPRQLGPNATLSLISIGRNGEAFTTNGLEEKAMRSVDIRKRDAKAETPAFATVSINSDDSSVISQSLAFSSLASKQRLEQYGVLISEPSHPPILVIFTAGRPPTKDEKSSEASRSLIPFVVRPPLQLDGRVAAHVTCDLPFSPAKDEADVIAPEIGVVALKIGAVKAKFSEHSRQAMETETRGPVSSKQKSTRIVLRARSWKSVLEMIPTLASIPAARSNGDFLFDMSPTAIMSVANDRLDIQVDSSTLRKNFLDQAKSELLRVANILTSTDVATAAIRVGMPALINSNAPAFDTEKLLDMTSRRQVSDTIVRGRTLTAKLLQQAPSQTALPESVNRALDATEVLLRDGESVEALIEECKDASILEIELNLRCRGPMSSDQLSIKLIDFRAKTLPRK